MFDRHIRTLLVAVSVVTLLATAVPAAAGQSVERPIKENLTGWRYPASSRSTPGAA